MRVILEATAPTSSLNDISTTDSTIEADLTQAVSNTYSFYVSGKKKNAEMYFSKAILVSRSHEKFYLRSIGFAENIRAWKNRRMVHPEYLFVCYDTHIFNTFKVNDYDTVPFVEDSVHNLMFSFNVDWFQPFNGSLYSCGAKYLTISNLPRSIRNLRENMIFVGLMPGGNGEASLDPVLPSIKMPDPKNLDQT